MARSRGYSVTECFVAAAVVVVAVGILVPAVSKVRAAAVRARCVNNLKQIGGGLQTYHQTRGSFPPGGAANPDLTATTPPAREAGGWTWAYALLPYIGHDQLYRDADPQAVRRGKVDLYLCAARRSAADPSGLAKLDYGANGAADAANLTGVIAPTGVMPLRLCDLSGGTSGVVVLAGKRLNLAALGTSRDDDDAFSTAGWGPDFEVYRTAAVPPAPDVTEPGNLEPRGGFGASHPGGIFCAAFADGSVRPLRYTIDPAVWQRACLRSGAPDPPSPNNN
ncbi:DUF1559 family PulG-like putative transporter [Urbifossiella limnaea]|uniref:DUF1559 domain-containing protein n=1 Tax=Urbifossiella limnaea TaxID=2528023 RepID=A0A517XY06_9BACT|nr:DUF1559 domain-containing protein [Urbifossiella limnaea]QDU22390.1 hypothetical protein ETAA1_43700 [Urbifossiella limnaea]